ncbi:MAG: N-acetylmuramoyl-L-alanine amidase [Eubacterium sp.]|nr:N-acetylmuramoyl-L-alanine amidase [Eubacterium sp.]
MCSISKMKAFGCGRSLYRWIFGFIFMLMAFGISYDAGTAYAATSETKTLTLTYNDAVHEYTGVQGKLNFQNKDYEFKTMPIVKLSDVLYAPAKELFQTVLGYSWSYDTETGDYIAYDDDLDLKVQIKEGEESFTILRGGAASAYSLSQPILMIQCGTAERTPCIPVTKLFKSLGYTASWSKKKATYTVIKSDLFDWTGETEDTDTSVNHIRQATGAYSMVDNMAYIDLNVFGDRQESFDAVYVDREDKLITVTLPDSTFLPELKMYDRFGDIAERMVVTEEEKKVTVTFYCEDVTEFTYTTNDKKLHLRLMWDYSTKTGKTTNYSLSFLRPDSTYLIDKITQKDCYDSVSYTKAFKLIVKGDHLKFYKANPVVINNNYVKKVKVSLSDAGNTVIKVTTTKLLGFKVERVGDDYVVTLDKPKKIYKNILVFDCGHGDHDNGASHNGVHEKNLNLKIGYKLLSKYFEKVNPEIKIYWTRTTDNFVTLDDRSKFASKVCADAFISLHMNSASNKKANGTEVYYSVDNNKVKSTGLSSSRMAEMMDEALVSKLKTNDRGVRTAGFYVIKRNSVPSILIELAFLSGNEDHKRMTKTSFQKKAADTIQTVINKIFTKYPSKR